MTFALMLRVFTVSDMHWREGRAGSATLHMQTISTAGFVRPVWESSRGTSTTHVVDVLPEMVGRRATHLLSRVESAKP